jgi:hypothetical protein
LVRQDLHPAQRLEYQERQLDFQLSHNQGYQHRHSQVHQQQGYQERRLDFQLRHTQERQQQAAQEHQHALTAR